LEDPSDNERPDLPNKPPIKLIPFTPCARDVPILRRAIVSVSLFSLSPLAFGSCCLLPRVAEGEEKKKK